MGTGEGKDKVAEETTGQCLDLLQTVKDLFSPRKKEKGCHLCGLGDGGMSPSFPRPLFKARLVCILARRGLTTDAGNASRHSRRDFFSYGFH